MAQIHPSAHSPSWIALIVKKLPQPSVEPNQPKAIQEIVQIDKVPPILPPAAPSKIKVGAVKNQIAADRTPRSRNANACTTAAGVINESTTNEQRMEEAISIVTAAVESLKTNPQWEAWKTKERMRAIQAKVKEQRGGIGISSQTLYRDWITPLWISR